MKVFINVVGRLRCEGQKKREIFNFPDEGLVGQRLYVMGMDFICKETKYSKSQTS
ncbi:MAG: hypothetical protein ACYS9T_11375 [Planctomycetota bacterium]